MLGNTAQQRRLVKSRPGASQIARRSMVTCGGAWLIIAALLLVQRTMPSAGIGAESNRGNEDPGQPQTR